MEKKAQLIQLPTHIVYDAGKTQIPAGSATVLSILGMLYALLVIHIVPFRMRGHHASVCACMQVYLWLIVTNHCVGPVEMVDYVTGHLKLL